MSTKSSLLRFDFAGPHGTAWGTANVGLTVVSITTCARVFFDAPWWIAGVTLGLGFVLTLGWALIRPAIRRDTTPPAAVVYQLACWTGAGIWSGWMLAQTDWTFKSWALGVVILAAAATIAGVLLGLGRAERPKTSTPEAELPDPELDGLTQGQRNALGDTWAMRINRLAGNPVPTATPGKPAPLWASIVKFSALVEWPTGCGYTLEGTFTSGKFGLPQLQALSDKLALDANLPYGCTVVAYEHPGAGAGRRDFLLDVTSHNALLDDQPFPENEGPFTINGGIPIGSEGKGDRFELFLREKRICVYGGTGSGKTGTMKALSSILTLTSDCVKVGIDATGGDLVRPELKAWEDGEADHPAFAAVAVSYAEAERLARALVRIGHARKKVYQYVLDAHNTTLLPMGAIVRRADLSPSAQAHFPHPDDNERMISQVMCLGDETKQYLRTAGNQPTLRQWIAQGLDELRGAGIGYAFGPLGPTNANIDQSIQDLIKTNIAMFLGKNSDYRDALGGGSVTHADFPMKPDGSGKLPGIGFAVLERGQQERQIRIWGEMKPDLVRRVAVRASKEGFLPDLDYISELAANGFLPDGSPWPCKRGSEMEESDRYYWRDRWTNWDSRRLQTEDEDGAVPLTTPTQAATGTAVKDRMESLRQRVAETERNAQERVAETSDVDEAELARIVDEWIAVAEDAAPPAAEPWRERILRAIRDAGATGIQAKDLIDLAGVHRSEVYKFLGPLVKEGRIIRSSSGYSLPPDER